MNRTALSNTGSQTSCGDAAWIREGALSRSAVGLHETNIVWAMHRSRFQPNSTEPIAKFHRFTLHFDYSQRNQVKDIVSPRSIL